MRFFERSKAMLMLAVPCILFSAYSMLASDMVTGKWKCVAKGIPDGDVEFTLELVQSGESLSGTISTDSGSIEISEAKVHGNKFEFSVMAPNVNYTVTGSVEGSNISGEWKDDQQHSGNWSGQKQQ